MRSPTLKSPNAILLSPSFKTVLLRIVTLYSGPLFCRVPPVVGGNPTPPSRDRPPRLPPPGKPIPPPPLVLPLRRRVPCGFCVRSACPLPVSLTFKVFFFKSILVTTAV